MCVTAELIEETRDGLRQKAKIAANADLELLQMHLAFEAEKFLRRHEAICGQCAGEIQCA